MADRIEQIERYLHNEMQETERRAFEQMLAADPQLQSEVTRMRLIDEALDYAIEQDLRDQLRSWSSTSENMEPIHQPNIRSIYKRVAIAAGLLLLVSMSLWFFLTPHADPIQQFADAHYIEYDYTSLRGDESARPDFPLPADHSKLTAQWLDTLSAWIEQHPDHAAARFLYADQLKQAGRIAEAKTQLAIIMSQQSLLWSEKAEWNYVLLGVQTGMDSLAAGTLQRIQQQSDHSYHRQSMELGKLLDK